MRNPDRDVEVAGSKRVREVLAEEVAGELSSEAFSVELFGAGAGGVRMTGATR
jgi:hypothetical protein